MTCKSRLARYGSHQTDDVILVGSDFSVARSTLFPRMQTIYLSDGQAE
ncbi:MAG: hypothetical protein GY924_09420 [Planctomycetaceae bacterium]|nr:hypothetical protein [Planctomycetaceae bacterium]